MFRKIVTELAYSPALAGNLGYYVKRLRNETSRRQTGLVFVVLAVVVQLFATLSPPESANAHNPDIFIDGGIASIDEYLGYYDKNTRNGKDLLDSLGITRSEIEVAKLAKISSMQTALLWSTDNPREEGSNVHFFTTSNTSTGVAYYWSPPSKMTSSLAYIGVSSKLGGKFALTPDGATLLTEKGPLSSCESWAASPSEPLKMDSWLNPSDPICSSILQTSLSARRISADLPTIEKLHASDRVAYTLSVMNKSGKALSVAPSVNLEDALEYSRILDYGGGEYDFDTRNLSWPTIQLEAGDGIERTLITQILPAMPATANGKYINKSYDCAVTLSFGSTLTTPVDCPPTKYIENLTHSLPGLPAQINIIAPLCLIIVSLFFYLRSRQLLTELYIIRHNHLGGL